MKKNFQSKVQSRQRLSSFNKSHRLEKKSLTSTSWNLKAVLLCIAVLLISIFVFQPSLKSSFTNWDDPVYVTENEFIRNLNPSTVNYFFTHESAKNYHPLTMLSLSLDYAMSDKFKQEKKGMIDVNAKVFHFTSILLHLANIILVFVFMYRLTRKRITIAFVTALLFGIHPLHVESVSWISERKDVLYSFFFLAGLISYLVYLDKSRYFYLFLTGSFFILSCLSKPAAVIFPLILFVIDYYRNRTFTRKTLAEKIPFLLLSVVFGLITFFVQSKDSVANFAIFSIFNRMLFACYGLVMYPVKLIFPYPLSAFYPYPVLSPSGYLPPIYYISPVIILVVAGIFLYFRKIGRELMFGFLFYVFSVVLVLQFISVGSAIMADRYSYLSSIGLFFIAGYYLDSMMKKKSSFSSFIIYGIGLVFLSYIVVLIYLTNQRVRVWKDSETLWSDVIGQYPGLELARKNRGVYYSERGQLDLALKDYLVLDQIHSKDAKVYSNLGNIYVVKEEYGKAFGAYNKSISLDSNFYDSYLNRGITFAKLKNYNAALSDFEHSLKIRPGSSEVLQNLAYTAMDANLLEKALNTYNQLIQQDPTNDDLFLKRGFCYQKMNNIPEAESDYLHCIILNPNNGYAFRNLSFMYDAKQDYRNALFYAQKAIEAGQQMDQSYLDRLKKNF